jgi:hypothetical protein
MPNYGLNKHAVKQLSEVARRVLRGSQNDVNGQSKRVFDSIPEDSGILFKNNGSQTVPPHGVMYQASISIENGRIVHMCERPTTYWDVRYLVNGPKAVAAGAYGYGTWLNDTGFVAYNTEHAPNAGEEWGVMPGSFLLRQGRPGFLMLGATTTINGQAVTPAFQLGTAEILGILNEDLDQGESATVRVYVGDADNADFNLVDSDQTITGYDWFMNQDESMEAETKVACKFYSGKWRIVQAYCKPDDTSSGGA